MSGFSLRDLKKAWCGLLSLIEKLNKLAAWKTTTYRCLVEREDCTTKKAALISAGHGAREVDMTRVKMLRRRIWEQTRHAIDLSLAGCLWPGVLSCCLTPETRVFEIHGEPSEGKWTSDRVRQGVLQPGSLKIA